MHHAAVGSRQLGLLRSKVIVYCRRSIALCSLFSMGRESTRLDRFQFTCISIQVFISPVFLTSRSRFNNHWSYVYQRWQPFVRSSDCGSRLKGMLSSALRRSWNKLCNASSKLTRNLPDCSHFGFFTVISSLETFSYITIFSFFLRNQKCSRPLVYIKMDKSLLLEMNIIRFERSWF